MQHDHGAAVKDCVADNIADRVKLIGKTRASGSSRGLFPIGNREGTMRVGGEVGRNRLNTAIAHESSQAIAGVRGQFGHGYSEELSFDTSLAAQIARNRAASRWLDEGIGQSGLQCVAQALGGKLRRSLMTLKNDSRTQD